MTVAGWIQILALVAVLTGLTPLLGGYMARVYAGESVALGDLTLDRPSSVTRNSSLETGS